MAAAIGAGLPVTEPIGAMVVDIGGGTTEVAVLRCAGLPTAPRRGSAATGMDDAIASASGASITCMIGESTAERVKIEIGMARRRPAHRTARSCG